MQSYVVLCCIRVVKDATLSSRAIGVNISRDSEVRFNIDALRSSDESRQFFSELFKEIQLPLAKKDKLYGSCFVFKIEGRTTGEVGVKKEIAGAL